MSERYLRGVEILHQLTGENAEYLTSRVAEIAPDFSRMTIEFPFGDLYARGTLGLREREIAAISALAVRGDSEAQLRVHVAAALNIGMTRQEVIEVLMQSAIYAGFPAALNALGSCHDLLVDNSECGRSQAAMRLAGQG